MSNPTRTQGTATQDSHDDDHGQGTLTNSLVIAPASLFNATLLSPDVGACHKIILAGGGNPESEEPSLPYHLPRLFLAELCNEPRPVLSFFIGHLPHGERDKDGEGDPCVNVSRAYFPVCHWTPSMAAMFICLSLQAANRGYPLAISQSSMASMFEDMPGHHVVLGQMPAIDWVRHKMSGDLGPMVGMTLLGR